jgi:two-component system sensor histidine kinase ChvG
LIQKIATSTGIRARVYDAKGEPILDSDTLTGEGTQPGRNAGRAKVSSFWLWLRRATNWSDLPVYRDIGRANGKAYAGVAAALSGNTTPLLMISEQGEHIVSVAVPVQRGGTLLGALMLSTRGGEIDDLIWTERKLIIGATLVALLAMLLSSFGLAWTIARPLRALSQAAEQVQRSLSRREELPDFTDRHDEIGHLSGTLRSMTDTLYRRIEASERFAADVAHELKNPLTSVRSAAETLGIVKSDAERKQFIETIQHDVKRLTRLIDDISKATRLEAEMALAEAEPVDLRDLLGTVVNVFNDVHVKHQQKVVLEIDETDAGSQDYIVNGFDIRLGQVFTNLLDNALSFSPEAGRVWVRARRLADDILIEIDDEGPGIPPGNLERIFARFYTDRPVASFGKNSGLGLSICKEIVTAHRGQIWAENRMRTAEPASRTPQSSNPVVVNAVLGARFSVRLPAAHPSATRTPRYIGRWK